MTSRARLLLCVLSAALCAAGSFAAAQEPKAPQAATPAELKAAINKLGDLDYATRTDAARVVRRTASAQAVPALLQAVAEHADGYVRYRALVLLTGFNDPRTEDAMRQSLASPNDRLRAVAYSYFEREPRPALILQFVEALDKEQGEFVRPALVRALASAARGDAPQAKAAERALVREVGRGENFFRSSVIEALGDFQGGYAFNEVAAVAKTEGPLQDDAALAIGKMGTGPQALELLAQLQRSAPRAAQPSISAAICLLGVNCDTHIGFLVETLKFSNTNAGFQELLRAAAAGLGALGVAGREAAIESLFAVGIPAKDDSTRAPVALALATVALRKTPLAVSVLERAADRDASIALLAEGFDMLEEDLDKERFYAFARRTYWDSPEGSPGRALMQTLIGKLDF
jgi:hypothetical protein